MNNKRFTFTGCDGAQLPAMLWSPDGIPRAVLQIVHGMTEYIDRYDALARFLARQGVVVAGYNLRGHGRNSGDVHIASFGEGGWKKSLEDMYLFCLSLQKRYPGVPHFMLGFSLGSFLLREYLDLYSDPIDGAVILGTGDQPGFVLRIMRDVVKSQIRKSGFDGTTPLVQKLSFETYNQKFKPNRTPSDWLCADEAQLDAYIRDWQCKERISSGLFWELLGAMQRTGGSDYRSWRKDMPVLLLSGQDDPVGDSGKGVQRVETAMRRAGMRNVRMQLFPGARHDLLHENASGSAEAARKLIAEWLKENLPEPESPEKVFGASDGEVTANELSSPRAQAMLETLGDCRDEFFQPVAEQDKNCFRKLRDCLREGASAGDPALTYLWAEFLYWGSRTLEDSPGYCSFWEDPDCDPCIKYILTLWHGCKCAEWDDMPICECRRGDDPGPLYWYEKAAEAGFIPAICWMYWCSRRGILMEPDEAKAARWLERARSAGRTDSFEFKELGLFRENAESFSESAEWADMDEPERIADPDSWAFHGASIAWYQLGRAFGAVDCVPDENIHLFHRDCEIPERFGPYYMLVEKRCWQVWCGLNGVGLGGASRGQLYSWISEAADYLPRMKGYLAFEKVAAQLESLVDELLTAVLCME